VEPTSRREAIMRQDEPVNLLGCFIEGPDGVNILPPCYYPHGGSSRNISHHPPICNSHNFASRLRNLDQAPAVISLKATDQFPSQVQLETAILPDKKMGSFSPQFRAPSQSHGVRSFRIPSLSDTPPPLPQNTKQSAEQSSVALPLVLLRLSTLLSGVVPR